MGAIQWVVEAVAAKIHKPMGVAIAEERRTRSASRPCEAGIGVKLTDSSCHPHQQPGFGRCDASVLGRLSLVQPLGGG